MSTIRFLTGITPSGTPHLGNYAGMLRPAIAASRSREVENFYFLADYHALIKCQDPARVQRSTIEIAASWLAAGLDPEHVTFYRQSDIPEIPELCWLLTCVTGKGLLNRAHAYKAAVDKNHADGTETDDGVTAGLFMYPVLMAADILAFNAHKVPVGRDQVQHIEMTRDMASSFNHIYGGEFFTLPEAQVEENVATLPGLDGRKMSKSYNNTIPLFSSREQLRKLIGSITTDSRTPGEPKEVEGSALFQIYQGFASEEETEALRRQYAEGIAWGDAKQQLFERIDSEITPLRERYDALMAEPEKIEALLRRRGQQLREQFAVPLLKELRHAVGLRDLSTAGDVPSEESGAARAAPPLFKQYREQDGRFYFKLQASDGTLLIQSEGFDSPRDAGQLIGVLKQTEHGDGLQSELFKLEAEVDVVLAALQALRG